MDQPVLSEVSERRNAGGERTKQIRIDQNRPHLEVLGRHDAPQSALQHLLKGRAPLLSKTHGRDDVNCGTSKGTRAKKYS